MLLYRCYVLLLSEDFAYIVTWLLHFFHADILQDAAPEQAEPISFLSFIHALHAWKRQMALWAAFYRSRCVKDKDKDMKDKPTAQELLLNQKTKWDRSRKKSCRVAPEMQYKRPPKSEKP